MTYNVFSGTLNPTHSRQPANLGRVENSPENVETLCMCVYKKRVTIMLAGKITEWRCLRWRHWRVLSKHSVYVSSCIIIIIIKCIYKVHFRGCHKCAENRSYTLNNNVFSLFLNVVRVISDDLSSSGRLFHTRGP